MVLLIVAVVIGALTPSVVRQISHARVNRAASVVAADLMQAQTLAGRQQMPVIVNVDGASKRIEVRTTTGSVISVRVFDTNTDYKLSTLSSTLTNILILPNGTTSGVATITVGSPGYNRQVRISRAGLVRVL